MIRNERKIKSERGDVLRWWRIQSRIANRQAATLALKVANGEAILSGVVASLSARQAAYEIALRTAGATVIRDELSVASSSSERGRSRHAPSD